MPNFEFWEKMELFEEYLKVTEMFLASEAEKRKRELVAKSEELSRAAAEDVKRAEEDVRAGRIPFNPPYSQYHSLNHIIFEIYDDARIELEPFEEQLSLVDEFANILRQSFLTSLYGFLESQLFQLCHALKSYDEKNTPILPDKRQFYLQNVKPFLKQIGFPIGSRLWQEIDNYRMFRNCIVHHEGKPDKTSEGEKLRRYIGNAPLLFLWEGEGEERIILKQGFCEETLDMIYMFYEEILIALTKWKATLPDTN